jgi:hypothetical protein
MAARVQLNNFRFSIYIDADGTVTFTDLPPELREVAATLDPAHEWGTTCDISPRRCPSPQQRTPQFVRQRQRICGEQRFVADVCRRMVGDRVCVSIVDAASGN